MLSCPEIFVSYPEQNKMFSLFIDVTSKESYLFLKHVYLTISVNNITNSPEKKMLKNKIHSNAHFFSK